MSKAPPPLRLASLLALLLVPSAIAQPPLLAPPSEGAPPALPSARPGLPHPAEVLGYPLGERFTRHDRLLTYLEALAAASERVEITEYGRSYQDRPLTLLTISSGANLARLEELRRANLRLAEPAALSAAELAARIARQPVVVWLAYGVHGDEASSSEVAMAVAYLLAAAEGEWAERLERLVVLVDPLVNPDGRERYLAAFESRRGRRADPSRDAYEHAEPWPGGRQNHYLVDLNRDWPWLTQAETRQRLEAYRRWEPQLYADYHEMSAESTYFFPPSAEPVHPRIDPAVLAWLEVFGAANAAAFDAQGWPYFVGEVYDLFYPGYGDSYPSLRGSVGMTFEMAGGGRAGSVLELRDGTRLTLADRLARHLTTTLTTLRTAELHRRELLRDFVSSRAEPAAEAGASAHGYLWRADQGEARALAELLEEHGARVGELTAEVVLPVRALTGGGAVERRFAAGSFVVSAGQPLGRLVEALIEPGSELGDGFLERQRRRVEAGRDTDFYDVTAWSLAFAFNLEVWVHEGEGAPSRPLAPAAARLEGEAAVGYLLPPRGLAGQRLVAEIEAEGLGSRLVLEELEIDGRSYPPGTVFVPRLGQGDELEARLRRALERTAGVALGVASSRAERGPSLGSARVVRLAPVRIGLIAGEGVEETAHGHLWHLLDRGVGLGHSRLDVAHLGRVDLERFDALLLPDGDYEHALAGAAGDALDAWVRRGGTLVAVGGAFDWLRERELTRIEAWRQQAEADAVEGDADEGLEAGGLEGRELETPGAILATEMSPSHPLTAGLATPPPVLFWGSRVLLATGDPKVDVLTARADDPLLAGFTWPEKVERLRGALLVSAEEVDEGKVIVFAQDPAFRLFWRGTMPLLLNALRLAPSLEEL